MHIKSSELLGNLVNVISNEFDTNVIWDTFADFLLSNGVKQWSILTRPLFKDVSALNMGGADLCGPQNASGFIDFNELLSLEDRTTLKKSLKHVIASEGLQTLLNKGSLSSADAETIKRIFGSDDAETIMICPAYGPHSNNVCLFYVLDDKKHSGLSLSIATAFQAIHNINSKIKEETKPRQRHLSPREVQILEAIAQGKTNEEVAQDLQISRYTINGYLKTIFLKMNCSDRTTAVLSGLALGIIG